MGVGVALSKDIADEAMSSNREVAASSLIFHQYGRFWLRRVRSYRLIRVVRLFILLVAIAGN